MFRYLAVNYVFRYLAVDYAGPAGSNEGVIMSKKPGPILTIFNLVKVRCFVKH